MTHCSSALIHISQGGIKGTLSQFLSDKTGGEKGKKESIKLVTITSTVA